MKENLRILFYFDILNYTLLIYKQIYNHFDCGKAKRKLENYDYKKNKKWN